MARQITFTVPDGIYDSIQEYMQDEGLPFVAPFVRNIICGMLGTQFLLKKQDMQWFKHLYFIRNLWGVVLREYKKLYGQDESYQMLSAMMFPINKLFFYSLDSKEYPLTNEQDAKLDDIALVLADFVNRLKLDDCNLKPNKIREKLNLEKLVEE